MTMPRHAIVLGSGFAGTLAAIVLAQLAETVTVVDRDRSLDGPGRRTGVPHARHTHVLVAGGARTLEKLLPGILDSLYSAGAQHIGIPERYLAQAPDGGWFPRYKGEQFIVGCSRDLLETAVQERLQRSTNVRFVAAAEVVGLTGDSGRITGVRTRNRATGAVDTTEADFVVDATGRSSRATEWLAELGVPEVAEEVVDPQIFYATRLYQAPDAATEFPAVNIAGNPAAERVRGSGILIPIEDGRWTVTLSGAAGGHPPLDDDGFAAFAAGLPHPAIAQLIASAEPLGSAFGFRAHANRRRRFEKLACLPGRFVVLGDAASTFNPVYGHGLTVAAKCAVALQDGLLRKGIEGNTAIQRAVARVSHDAWSMATSQDLRYPETIGPKPGRADELLYRIQDRLGRSATSHRAIAAAQLAVFTLSAPPTALLRPSVLLAALRGPDRRASTRADPPFTPQEKQFLATLPAQP